ncbi:MAG: hypothetical protein K2K66_03440 [Ruminococcus sp.]|nr:hypothetical protein [Ruminococcus sp.]
MKKLSALLICPFMLTSCGKAEIILGATETFLEKYMSHDDYPVVTYEIQNSAGEKYTVVYQLRTGFPDMNVDVEIKKFDNVIYKYNADWKSTTTIPEDTSIWNDCASLPEKIAYLFEYDGGGVYYIQNNARSPYNNPSCEIVYDGENVPDFMNTYQEKTKKTAEFLYENITEQEIIDIFDKCGYDDQYILEIYRYSGKN